MSLAEEHDFYQRVQGIINDISNSPAHNRVEIIKRIAEAKCEPAKTIRRRLRKGQITREEVEKKQARCIKRQIMQVWFQFRKKEELPITVKGVSFSINKEGKVVAEKA